MSRDPRWRLLLIRLVGLVVLAVWWWRRQAERECVSDRPVEFAIPIGDTETEVAAYAAKQKEPSGPGRNTAPCENDTPDDLTEIEGIGPKTSKVFVNEGITTFAQLATSEVAELERVLRQAGVRLAYPGTWPEQAALAARGDWEGLAALQAQLHRGRRV
jgi:predicted flap endonuclease-1-like 5' DNA nuclease